MISENEDDLKSVEDPVELDVEIAKLSLAQDDLLVVKTPINLIGNNFHSLVSALQQIGTKYKELNVKILVLPEGVEISKMDPAEMAKAGFVRLKPEIIEKKETQEIKRVDG